MGIQDAKDDLRTLVQGFDRGYNDYTDPDYNETQTRNDFIDNLLEILGWDVDNEAGKPKHLREVKLEASVEEEETVRKPDYELRDDKGERKFFVEAKKPSVSLTSEGPLQTRRYGWNAGLSVSILTNFEELIIYDCTEVPEEGDGAQVGRLRRYHYTEYEDNFEEIYRLFSKEAVVSGAFDEEFEDPSEQRETETFDDIFLEQLEEWRETLARNVIENNSEISENQLNYFVHRLLNRIIFLRISEDRNHEPYERLKEIEDISYDRLYEIFQEADQKYNSKLFDLIEDYSAENIDIDADVIASVLEELYYPQSPYTFAVVESHIIGKIYDLFLGKSLVVENGSLSVEEKPEIEHSQGVVTTPEYIVEEIVTETIGSEVADETPSSLDEFSIADICCGSGVFLVRAYEEVLRQYRNYYTENNPAGRSEVEQIEGEWVLNLHERRKIAERHIYGVDIDQLAVEVARFSLLLKILEDQPRSAIDSYHDRYGGPILPDLSDNIKCGNSLVDESFQTFIDDPTSELLSRVNPFSFDRAFPDVTEQGGFSAIIGNPPYIRIQNMVEYLPEEEMEFYSEGHQYTCASSNNYDKYSLFIERSLELLNSSGTTGQIIPQKYTTLAYGRHLRKIISDGNHLKKLVHFGTEQVFNRHSNYTCILYLSNEEQDEFPVLRIHDLEEWKDTGESDEVITHNSDLDDEPWSFVGSEVDRIFERISQNHPKTLDDVSEIFVGAQTSWNRGYEIKEYDIEGNCVVFEGPDGNEWSIERGIVRPYFYTTNRWKPTIEPLSQIQPNGLIIYPYHSDGTIISESEMQRDYPKAWDYFNCHEERLEDRDLQDHGNNEFYRYGRSQSLGKFAGEKIVVQVLSKEPRYGYDNNDVVVTGGGNGPFYNIRPYNDLDDRLDLDPDHLTEYHINYIMAIISHPVIEAMVRSESSFFRGGYYSHGKQFIENIPIKFIDDSDTDESELYDRIVALVDEHMDVQDELREASTENEQRLLEQRRDVLRTQIEEAVSELYGISAEEIEIAKQV